MNVKPVIISTENNIKSIPIDLQTIIDINYENKNNALLNSYSSDDTRSIIDNKYIEIKDMVENIINKDSLKEMNKTQVIDNYTNA